MTNDLFEWIGVHISRSQSAHKHKHTEENAADRCPHEYGTLFPPACCWSEPRVQPHAPGNFHHLLNIYQIV